MSRECRTIIHIFSGINGEGVRRWSANRVKMTVSGGGCRAGMGTIKRSGTMCGAISGGEK